MENIFDKGDWVYANTRIPVHSKVQKVVSVHDSGYYLSLDLSLFISANRVRRATEEEIESEKERRLTLSK